MSNIDPAEATLAVVGIDSILDGSFKRITEKQRKRIDKLDEEIRSRAKSMIRAGLAPSFSLPPDYFELLDQLTKSKTFGEVEKMTLGLPIQVATGVKALVSNIYSFLQTQVPRNSVKTIAGGKVLTANDPDYFRFHWVYSVIRDPVSVTNLISAGALFRSQADAVNMFFPSVSAAIDEAIDDEIPNARAKEKDFEVPFDSDIGLKVWRSLPVIDGTYQDTYVNANKQRDVQQQPSKAQLDKSAQSALSPAQLEQYPRAAR